MTQKNTAAHVAIDATTMATAATVDTAFNYWCYERAKACQAGADVKFPKTVADFQKLRQNGRGRFRGFLPPYMLALIAEQAITSRLSRQFPNSQYSDFFAAVSAGAIVGCIFTVPENAIVLRSANNLSSPMSSVLQADIRGRGLLPVLMGQTPGTRATAGREAAFATTIFGIKQPTKNTLCSIHTIFQTTTDNKTQPNQFASLAASLFLAGPLSALTQPLGILAAVEQTEQKTLSISDSMRILRSQAQQSGISLQKLFTRGLGWRWFTLTCSILTIDSVEEICDRSFKALGFR